MPCSEKVEFETTAKPAGTVNVKYGEDIAVLPVFLIIISSVELCPTGTVGVSVLTDNGEPKEMEVSDCT
jgi:hypothetical protein